MTLLIEQVEYDDPKHGIDLIQLLDHYARSPMGGGKPLPPSVTDTLVDNLGKLPHAISLLAYDGDEAIGLLNAFETFSTFSNEPLINIHDIVVYEEHRGKGIGRKLLAVIEEIAKSRGCCKITLEVLSGNETAKKIYRKFGFEGYALDSEQGEALFWQKKLV